MVSKRCPSFSYNVKCDIEATQQSNTVEGEPVKWLSFSFKTDYGDIGSTRFQGALHPVITILMN
ncbi:hypothetical protein GCM10010916_41700 [Paenibacillus abyssi]|uniref:Uncharacterized protein n=1 Tax=Paenibacillus abyssi TaxID=1340531 RepID=A0A917G313_9BACL|nr:hypothetical protein GCM10010916_41700 [Paenibacillus abyssi]